MFVSNNQDPRIKKQDQNGADGRKITQFDSIIAVPCLSKLYSQEPVLSLTKASKDILCDGEGLIIADQVMTRLMKSGPIKFKITIDKK